CDGGLQMAAMLQYSLRFRLIAPKIRLRALLFQPRQFFTFRVRVKETSAIPSRGWQVVCIYL
ncbi:MAG TPA: hypothetical protein VJX67_02855, partial [Blastocatellia bacterium]|nr:hypothetical protein [Blastocatellia bacterium]